MDVQSNSYIVCNYTQALIATVVKLNRRLSLTYLPLEKIYAISQMLGTDAFPLMKIVYFYYKFTEVISKGPIDNNLTLV